MPEKQIRVVVVDDHAIMREGLVLLLEDEPDIEVVAAAGSGQGAIDAIQEHDPDVALVDIAMDDMTGLEVTRRVLAQQPDTKIIIVTMHEEKAFFVEALESGAVGYFLKGSDSRELIETIRTVYNGGLYLSPTMSAGLTKPYIKPDNTMSMS